MYGINSIKEENMEESSIYYDCTENKNKNVNNIEEKNNKLRNNKLKEERDHSTSVSSNPQISNSKSNISAKEINKKLDKNDGTPINDENLFQITPHFWNENPTNKHSIQLKYNDKKGNEDKKRKNKFARPLTPNLNIIRKSAEQVQKKEEKKEIKIINNLIMKNRETNDDKRLETKEDIKDIVENNLSKRMGKEITKTESNIKKRSFSYTKNKISKNSKILNTNCSINENEIKNNKQNHQIINYYNNNYKLKNNKNNNNIYNLNKSNLPTNNKVPFSFNNNVNLSTKNNINSKNLTKKKKRTNSSMPSHRNSTNSSQQKKKYIRNFSRQKKNDVYTNNVLKPFKSENKIRVVHSKVNYEINNLFKGLSDNIAKDPEVHNKIESLIKDIKDIKKVVLRKTQSNFRPRKQSLVEYKNVDNIC